MTKTPYLVITFLLTSMFTPFLLANDAIEFDFRGMKKGDKLTEDFAYSHCPSIDKGKPNITCSKSIEFGGDELFAIYYFEEYQFIGVTLTYEYDLYEKLIVAYTQKFGVAPNDTDTGKFWITDAGTFLVTPKRADLISDEMLARAQREQKAREKALLDNL